MAQCRSTNIANSKKVADDDKNLRVNSARKLDKLDLRDVPKPGLSGVMHYKQACTITDAS